MTDAQEKWKKISSDTLEIMLPKSFIGGNPRKDKRRITEEISRCPEDLKKKRIKACSNADYSCSSRVN